MKRLNPFKRLSPMEELKLKTDQQWAEIQLAFYTKINNEQFRNAKLKGQHKDE